MRVLKILFFLMFGFAGTVMPSMAAEPDSAYIFAYSTAKNRSSNGMHFAYSTDRNNWFAIGPEMRFLFCDYGRWGNEKRLVNPFLFREKSGRWHCVWSVNEYDHVFAHTYSDNLTYWYPQTYPKVSPSNCLFPEIQFDKQFNQFVINWFADEEGRKVVYGNTTKDFKQYSATERKDEITSLNSRESLFIAGEKHIGTIHKVEWQVIDHLMNHQKLTDFKISQEDESYQDDAVKFSGIKQPEINLKIDIQQSKPISDKLMGIFFEDINYAADGGLYAELVQNRGFEYRITDKDGRDKTWNATKSWKLSGTNALINIDSVSPIHFNNRNYLVLKTSGKGTALINEGFNGMVIKSGEKYDFSLFARINEGKAQWFDVKLISAKGDLLAKNTVKVTSANWKKSAIELIAKGEAKDAVLSIEPLHAGTVHLDMISLFPQQTFKNRKNGLRADLAKYIADMHPRFVRFPGGCVAHGDGLGNIYHWKNTIGPLESRKPQRNIWGYHQSAGLGYFEYFQFCEDVGAEPLPVVAAGVPCQNSHTGGAGQQGGIPMCDMHDYVQDVLDLIEYANGDMKTKWGKKRAEAGHPKPFNLKYVGIGNEDLINDIFEERFTLIYQAVKLKYPEIVVIGTVGPFWEGTDYVEGWKIADKLKLEMVDEHYYNSPGWFINHHDFYDKYDRSKSAVYLGEWASRGNRNFNALTEAHYLTALERNADVVKMASYAPLLAKEGFTQWNPDLIYFNNAEVKPTVNYYVQQLYGEHAGDQYISNSIYPVVDLQQFARKRLASSVVKDTKTGDIIVKLVNLLPVKVKTNINLTLDGNFQTDALHVVLSGKPDDRDAKPDYGNIQVSDKFVYDQPAYSFSLIRIKKK